MKHPSIQLEVKAHHHPCTHMGCAFVLTAVHNDPQKAWDAIRAADKEIKRIEELISSWKSTSQTSIINKMAGLAAVKIEKELFDLIFRSVKISELTSGSFDISGTLSRYYWNFNNKENAMLSETKVQELRSLIDYKSIEFNEQKQTVFLKKKGMKIGFGGIGKGYAAQRAKAIMESQGIKSGLINASGDLICWGKPPKKNSWNIKIPDPMNRDHSLIEFTLPYGSVVSSGNHENFTIIDGKKHSHIVDPRTGHPVSHIKQVSVVSPDSEFADAMATALSVMCVEEGLGVVNQLKGIECIIINTDDEVYYSNYFNDILSAKAA